MKKSQISSKSPRIGEIYLMNFDGMGSEQRGFRPGVVFQNNMGNQHSPNVIALPLTSAIKKSGQPTHVLIPKEIGLAKDSMVLCENPEKMSKGRLGRYICTLPDEYITQIAVASLLSSSAISYIEPEKLLYVWKEAVILNTPAAI